jgi:tartrate dehydratase beta subunit/fumarate hydratase class I family protein
MVIQTVGIGAMKRAVVEGRSRQRPPRVLFTISAALTDSVSMKDSSAMVIQTVGIEAMKRVVVKKLSQ